MVEAVQRPLKDLAVVVVGCCVEKGQAVMAVSS